MLARFLQNLELEGIKGVTTDDIAYSRIIKVPGNSQNQAILLIRFRNEEKRNHVYKLRTKLKLLTNQKMFVNEDLLKDDAQLFNKAQQEVKDKKLHSVWTLVGCVWAKSSERGQAFCLSDALSKARATTNDSSQ